MAGLLGLLSFFESAQGAIPEIVIYEGHLLDSRGNAVLGSFDLRFSLWMDSDLKEGNIIGGEIDVLAENFGGWLEVHTISFDSNGDFSVQLGSILPLIDVDPDKFKFMQIEIKEHSRPSTDFELLDPTGDQGADTNDRQIIGSAFYARNAARLDSRQIGESVGNIAILGEDGRWKASQIPSGTTQETFILDENDDAAGEIKLIFGKSLSKFLSFDLTNSQFHFNDSVQISGDLTVGQIFSSTIDGQFNVLKNIEWESIKTKNKSIALVPEYSGAVILEDGANNSATIKLGFDQSENRHFYFLTSSQVELQDLDICVAVKLPPDFAGWQEIPFELAVKNDSVDPGNNQIDFLLKDTNGVEVVLPGSRDFFHEVPGAWGTKQFAFDQDYFWQAGGTANICLKMKSRNNFKISVGEITLNYLGK